MATKEQMIDRVKNNATQYDLERFEKICIASGLDGSIEGVNQIFDDDWSASYDAPIIDRVLLVPIFVRF